MEKPAAAPTSPKLSWRFPAVFWHANVSELCERAAYYGMFISLYRYLNVEIGFTDTQTGLITGFFAGGLYFFPLLMGIMADKIGFKQALMLAFTLLTVGYAILGGYQLKTTALVSLALIMFGGAIIKPCISGTVAKCSDADHRARAMSIFYMVVNIGSFSGKGLAGYLNEELGLRYINYYSAGMSLVALVVIACFYRNIDTEGVGKTVRQALGGLTKVLGNLRFLSLIFIIAGFWVIQVQLYGAMPSYIERMLGKGYKPEWLANINPLVVVCCVVAITHLVRRFKPVNAIGISLGIIPFTAIVIASTPILQGHVGDAIDFRYFTLHPLVLMMILGIGLQGLAECFLSPKWLEYVSKQAPKNEVGLYLGYSYLTSFISWMLGLFAAGMLLNAFCPDPRSLPAEQRHEWRLATDKHYCFTLPEAAHAAFKGEIGVAAPLRAAFQENGLALADTTRLAELEPKDSWRRDPERQWVVYEPLLTILEMKSQGEGGGSGVKVTVDSPDLPFGEMFENSSEILGALASENPGEAIREVLKKLGVSLPETTYAFKERTRSTATETLWCVGVKRFTIDESKLETDAVAVAAGREFARRELTVASAERRVDATSPQLPAAYAHAHYLWYVFAGVGVTAFLALLVFKFVTDAADRRTEQARS